MKPINKKKGANLYPFKLLFTPNNSRSSIFFRQLQTQNERIPHLIALTWCFEIV